MTDCDELTKRRLTRAADSSNKSPRNSPQDNFINFQAPVVRHKASLRVKLATGYIEVKDRVNSGDHLDFARQNRAEAVL
jgi:hypothetical protein